MNQEAIKPTQTKLLLAFCVSRCVNLSLSYLVLSVGIYCIDMASKQQQAFRMCGALFNGWGYTRSLCCLFGRGACTVSARPLRMLRSRLAFFRKDA